MTIPRGLFVLLLMIVVGVAIVVIRSETARVAGRNQKLHSRQLDLEQELWTKEMELARLRGPEEIRRRAAELQLEVVPPSGDSR